MTLYLETEKPESRCRIATRRAQLAYNALFHCTLCAHNCGVNRINGRGGICHSGSEARIFSAQVEVSDELELIPTFAIAFSGCDLRCAFCITGRESWNPNEGAYINAVSVAESAKAALANGARTIMILGGEPTVHLPAALEIVSHLPEEAKLIWKTNAHCSVQARELLDGIFDVWVADYKFGNDKCAQKLALVPNYTAVVRDNLVWANSCTDLILRHLVMPGHVECCWRPIAEWVAENLPHTKVNLRSGFWPAWHARKHREFHTTTSRRESELAWTIAREYNLHLVE